jgi:hypothetical protein
LAMAWRLSACQRRGCRLASRQVTASPGSGIVDSYGADVSEGVGRS